MRVSVKAAARLAVSPARRRAALPRQFHYRNPRALPAQPLHSASPLRHGAAGTQSSSWPGGGTAAAAASAAAACAAAFSLADLAADRRHPAAIPVVTICAAPAETPFAAADAAFEHGNWELAEDQLARSNEPDGAEKWWRQARIKYTLACNTKATAEKNQYLEDALALITQAHRANELIAFEARSGDVYRWYGIVLQEHASVIGGTKALVGKLFEYRRAWEDALRINPKDSRACHLIGRWHLGIVEISWFKKKLVRTLFAELPQDASYESALEYFEKAERIAPDDWIMNLVLLAKCQLALGQTDKAKASVLRAQANLASVVGSPTPDDLEAGKEAAKLLKRCK